MSGDNRSGPADRDPSAEELVELTVVARQAGVKIVHVRRYLEFGLFEPHPDAATKTPRFDPGNAARVARAERLRRDLGLNYPGAVLVCELLDRISQLETRR
jgi:chaperone modulatory protein CbpM